MIFKKTLCFLLMLLCLLASSQTKQVKITNKQNDNLFKASIIGITNNSFTLSDSNGFAILLVNNKYKITFVGYYDTIITVDSKISKIVLFERVQNLSPVLISTKKEKNSFFLDYENNNWKELFWVLKKGNIFLQLNHKSNLVLLS